MSSKIDGSRIDAQAADDGVATRWRPQAGFIHSVTSPDQLERLNASGGIAVSFATQGRSVHLAFQGSQSETLSVWETQSRTGFITSPMMTAELVTIRFVEAGAMVRINQNGADVIVSPAQALLTSFDVMRREQATPGFSAISATVSRSAVLDACRALFGAETRMLPQFETVVDLDTTGLRAVRSTVTALRQHLSTAAGPIDLMLPLLQEVLLYQLAGSWPMIGTGSSLHIPTATGRAVRQAVDYIEAHLRERIAIRDLAEAAGISVRALQIAFKQQMGCTPINYIIARRLDRVHAQLRLSESETIRQVAASWGFVHMSDFAKRYRERFGHLPSSRHAGG
ncbi:helix-turn-helix transcriptional regulator [Sphingomonas carotinifaciens]|uniref:helix-turn-helix transcriptional regulator n=1 Tax=Sphingomonas carotinifaciens TaxID=1166323 RepID=UPI000DD57552|nr:AraC family transcriptional regulator [Sphingomonas carotinifaciens]